MSPEEVKSRPERRPELNPSSRFRPRGEKPSSPLVLLETDGVAGENREKTSWCGGEKQDRCQLNLDAAWQGKKESGLGPGRTQGWTQKGPPKNKEAMAPRLGAPPTR